MPFKTRVIKRVRYKDKGLNDFLKLVDKKYKIEAGVIGAPAKRKKLDYHGKRTSATVGEVASVHEAGLGVPKRDFLNQTFVRNQKKYRRAIVSRLRFIAMQSKRISKARNAMKLLGEKVVSDAKKTLLNRMPPPLAKRTIRNRRQAFIAGTTPLVARGQLFTSLNSKVLVNK
jgi:hypothetical protein